MLRLLLTTLLVLPACPAAADDAKTTYTPAKTTIAVLPAINQSSDKWSELKDKEALQARESVYEAMRERGFQAVEPARVEQAVKEADIDLTREDQWTKANLYRLGKAVGSDLVAFVLIKQTRQKTVSNLLFSQFVGEAEVEVWLVDARQEQPILTSRPARGQARGGIRGATTRRLSAVNITVRDAFKPFLKDYPVLSQSDGKGKGR